MLVRNAAISPNGPGVFLLFHADLWFQTAGGKAQSHMQPGWLNVAAGMA
jgi:hypothetical protein